MRTFVRFSVTPSILFAALVFAPGCSAPAQNSAVVPVGARLARLELMNLSECDWSLAIATTDGRDAHTARLSAHATLRLELPGGDYDITQTALTGLSSPETTRRFPAHLESGESYRWRLATLLTGQTGASP